ncbi:MAG: hypothetical protein CL609_01450 [Anaerolineaceae bacterium]|nr:hypothetical protein [Anaerolineaceae bacterium]
MIFENDQIFITALITILLSAAIWGGLFYSIGSKQKIYGLFLILMLPFSALVNLLIKSPLNQMVIKVFDLQGGVNLQQPLFYLLFLAFLAPVTEEFIKILPIFLPAVRERVKKDPLWSGAWLGLGFGLGEALFIAYGISKSSQFVGLPWYAFGGYVGERFVVCLIHAILTGLLTWFIFQKKFFVGYGLAILLHFFVNIGAFLLALGIIGLAFVNILFLVSVIILVLIFEKIRKNLLKSNINESEETVYFRRSK